MRSVVALRCDDIFTQIRGDIMKCTSLLNTLAVATCVTGALLAGPSSHAAASDSGQLEEITVTAERQVQNVQKVPISIVAITPDLALNAGVLRSDQLGTLVPGMQMGHEINAATTFIRGIGPNSNGTGEESSVAVYLDDLYIPTGNASIFQLNATTGIDVLKGPQGTLFGRNATGGVVQVHTRDPAFEPSADFDVGYANYRSTSGSASDGSAIADPSRIRATCARSTF